MTGAPEPMLNPYHGLLTMDKVATSVECGLISRTAAGNRAYNQCYSIGEVQVKLPAKH